MSSSGIEVTHAAYIESLRLAHAARRGVTPSVEVAVRAYAQTMREANVPISTVLVEMKDLIRAHTGQDEPIFTPKVVGWAVAGYFAGTSIKGTDAS